MRRTAAKWAVFSVVGAAGMTGVMDLTSGQSEAGKAPVAKRLDINQLGWIEGDWRTTIDGDVLQEVWSEVLGDSMMGMFRWTKGGQVKLFELCTITQENGDIAYRFRHFSRLHVSWEEKDKPISFKLTKLSENEAVFENPEQANLNRLTYRRMDDGSMKVILDGQGKDGKPSTKEFHYRRATK